MATDGETMLYTTACAMEDNVGDGSFAPLQVHYTERFSAAGRTSGGYLKREGKPKDHEVLVARLIDRPIRPMIQAGWTHSTQVLTWVMSYDGEHLPRASGHHRCGRCTGHLGCLNPAPWIPTAADVPLRKAVAGARVGLLPGRGFVVNPTVAEQQESSLDLLIAGTSEAVLMIEGFCDFLTEEQMLEAVRCGHEAIQTMCLAIEAWAAEVGKPKKTDDLLLPPEGLDDRIHALIGKQIEEAYRTVPGKKERGELVSALRQQVRLEACPPQAAQTWCTDRTDGSQSPALPSRMTTSSLERVESAIMRRLVLEDGFRADGRSIDAVRPIWSRAGVLPRTHGSVLFTRGETQALARAAHRHHVADDEEQRFYLQYFFPPSSVGEVGRVGAQAGERSAMATWQSARCCRWCPRRRSSPTPSAWRAPSPSPTAPPPWPLSAAAACPCWTRASP
ncbi:hypothetical protein ABPG77_002643 [Micractinium sp. CCAP 211/92]